jgi:hypothetical protein
MLWVRVKGRVKGFRVNSLGLRVESLGCKA